jgi:hypothetical protein
MIKQSVELTTLTAPLAGYVDLMCLRQFEGRVVTGYVDVMCLRQFEERVVTGYVDVMCAQTAVVMHSPQ